MTRFAFVVHPISTRDVARRYPIAKYAPAWLIEQIIKRKKPVLCSKIEGVRSITGAETEGWFIACPLTPKQMLSLPLPFVYKRIIECTELAASLGADLIGLGAFTSVVGDGGVTVAKHSPIPVTTGNSYTVATAIEGTLKACEAVGICPSQATLAVVGATGSIGKTCAKVLSKRFGKTILVGRDVAKVEALAAEISEGLVHEGADCPEFPLPPAPSPRTTHRGEGEPEFPLPPAPSPRTTHRGEGEPEFPHPPAPSPFAGTNHPENGEGEPDAPSPIPLPQTQTIPREGAIIATADMAALREADAIITVTSSEVDVVMPEHLKPGCVVCDVARPRDVSIRVAKERPDVLVIEGGVVRVPGDVKFNFDFGFPAKTAYACMSETMMLALEGRPESFTLGKDVSVAQVEETMRLAEKHGFALDKFRAFEKVVGDDAIERARAARMSSGSFEGS